MSEPTTKYNFGCKAKELQLGDVIVTTNPHPQQVPWSTCIVKKITDTEIHLFRPYGATADFTYTGGVICYIGIEEYTISRDDRAYWVFQRPTLR